MISTSPSRTRTVVAVDLSCSAAPPMMWSPAAACSSACLAATASHSGVPGVWADSAGSSSSASQSLPVILRDGSTACTTGHSSTAPNAATGTSRASASASSRFSASKM